MVKRYLTLDVPQEVKGKKFEQEFLTAAQEVLREQTVLRLFEQGKISSGYGAKLLGISRRDFLDLLAKRGVPFFNYTNEELKNEFQAADDVLKQLGAEERKKQR